MIKVIMMRLLTLNVKQVAIVGRKLWWKIGNTLREDVITNQGSRKLLSFLVKIRLITSYCCSRVSELKRNA